MKSESILFFTQVNLDKFIECFLTLREHRPFFSLSFQRYSLRSHFSRTGTVFVVKEAHFHILRVRAKQIHFGQNHLFGSPNNFSLLFGCQNSKRPLGVNLCSKKHIFALCGCMAFVKRNAFIWDPRRFKRGMAHPHTPAHGQVEHHKMIFIYRQYEL